MRISDWSSDVCSSDLHDNRLAVSATPSMASAWLVPRLGGFLAAHPQVEISLQSTESVVDFSRETQIVAALRIGLGQWPGVVSEHLFDEWLVPMASPADRKSTRLNSRH